ncbi:RNA-directed DNA polymerase, eukaryota, reverse transcriptase zinc-binding domain protein [Tanacetum coccineum]
MSVELLDGAIILGFVEDDEAFNGSVQDRFANLDTNHDGLLSYSEMLNELKTLRMIETHFGIDVKTDPEELSQVYDSLFVQFDRDSNGTVDLEEFKAETKRMMLDMANDLGFLPVQMILDEDSFLKKAVDRDLMRNEGTWNINIVDETLDSSDNLNVNSMEKVEDSVDENSLADLNDLNELKETINELASNRIQYPISKENMDQKDDINKVSPEIAVSSDLSRPPSFEHMKITSSKCSTSFAIYRKKDIKGVSLIEELSRIIERNTVGDCYMINIYGPQDSLAKAILCNRIGDFMQQLAGKYIIFGDMNIVRNENERSGSLFSGQDADNFNSFIDNSSLIDLTFGGHVSTWMNKAETKLSKLDRFLISKEVVEALPDVHVTSIDRLRLDHNLILFHVSKSDFGPTPFKLFHSWILRDCFDEVIKTELPKLEEHNFRGKLLSYEKLRLLKARIKQWHSETKTSHRVTKHDNLQVIKSIEEKIEAGSENDDDRDSRIKFLQKVDRLDTLNSLIFFKRRVSNRIWKVTRLQIFSRADKAKKESSTNSRKAQRPYSNVEFPLFPNSSGLCSLDRDSLETPISLDEVKNTVWDYGSSKAPSLDGLSFAFVKKY